MNKWIYQGKKELIEVPIDEKKYQDLIAELAEILYVYFNRIDQRHAKKIPHRDFHCQTTEEVAS